MTPSNINLNPQIRSVRKKNTPVTNNFQGNYAQNPASFAAKGDSVSFKGANAIVKEANGYQYKEITKDLKKVYKYLAAAGEHNEINHFKESVTNWQDKLPNGIKEEGRIFGLPEAKPVRKLIDVVVNPFKSMSENIKKIGKGKTKNSEDTTMKRMRDALGLIKFIEQEETSIKAKLPNITDIEMQNEIIQKMADEVIKGSNGQKATYSNKSFATGARIISGVFGAWFLANDNYNMVRSIDDDKKKAKEAANTRLKQQAIRVAIGAYTIYATKQLFEQKSNATLSGALQIALLAAIIPEVLSRVFSGRPILPISKAKAIELNKKQEEKDAKANTNKGTTSNNNKPAFKGLHMNEATQKNAFTKMLDAARFHDVKYKKQDFLKIINTIKTTAPKSYERCIEVLKKVNPDIETKLANEGKELEAEVFIGKKETAIKKTIDAIFSPILMIVKKFNKKEKAKEKVTVEDVQNYILFIHNKLKSLHDGQSIEDTINNTQFSTFHSARANYDMNKYSLFNRIFSGVLSGAFVIADDYNLSMQQTKGDQDVAMQNGRKRGVQKTVSIGISAYIMAMTASMFGKFTNASLPFALAITGVNNVIYEILTRKLIGQPIYRKDKKEYDEIQAHNEKVPLYKAMNKVIGKKRPTKPAESKNEAKKTSFEKVQTQIKVSSGNSAEINKLKQPA